MREKIQNLSVEEYTTQSTITAEPDTTYEDLVKMMVENNVRHLPVTVEGKAVGIISERNLKLVTDQNQLISLTAKEIMTDEPYSVYPDTPLEDVAFELSSRKIGSAIVEDAEGQLIGIFTTTDALNALIEVIRGDI